MKKILSLATMFVVTVTLCVAPAQEQPKKETATKETKMSCCSKTASAKSGCSDAKASHASNKANCDKSKCADEAKMSQNETGKKPEVIKN